MGPVATEVDPAGRRPSQAGRPTIAQARRARASAALLAQQARSTARRAIELRQLTRVQRRRFTGVILVLDADAPQPGPVGTVLVADDDATIRETLRDILELAHYEVLVAEDGAQALRVLAGRDVDVLVLDLSMPNVDGWEVLRGLTERRPAVIVHTGNELTPRDIREFFDRRPFGVLPKPVAPTHMLAAVAGAVARARASA
jgi:CheY-like chemotaxis protein